MIEAELKAIVRDVERVREALASLSDGELATYRDVYYDRPDESLDAAGYEVRLRTVETEAGVRHLLTYKEPAVDESGSKPEHETTVADPGPVDVMLRGLGMVELVALTKHCANFRFEFDGRAMLATLVTVPELEGTFLEVETMAEEGEHPAALDAVLEVMEQLGLGDDLDASTYTGSVREARR
jgi:adenylate cyclase class 2